MLHPTSVVKTPNVCDGHQSALVFYRHQYTTKAEHVRNFDPHHDKAATFLFQRKVIFLGISHSGIVATIPHPHLCGARKNVPTPNAPAIWGCILEVEDITISSESFVNLETFNVSGFEENHYEDSSDDDEGPAQGSGS